MKRGSSNLVLREADSLLLRRISCAYVWVMVLMGYIPLLLVTGVIIHSGLELQTYLMVGVLLVATVWYTLMGVCAVELENTVRGFIGSVKIYEGVLMFQILVFLVLGFICRFETRSTALMRSGGTLSIVLGLLIVVAFFVLRGTSTYHRDRILKDGWRRIREFEDKKENDGVAPAETIVEKCSVTSDELCAMIDCLDRANTVVYGIDYDYMVYDGSDLWRC